MTLRKIFNFDNLFESRVIKHLKDTKELFPRSVSACGCLIFRKSKTGEVQLFLISYTYPRWPKLDDLGGCIDLDDQSVTDAIIRETSEKTNGVINNEVFKQITSNEYDVKSFYNHTSKYYGLLVEVPETFYPDTTIFGDFETADKIKRVINWHNYKEVKSHLALRLSLNLSLMNYLNLQDIK
jgi:ADP-ribose pyrophosphatase YjhB (NUDIX family)